MTTPPHDSPGSDPSDRYHQAEPEGLQTSFGAIDFVLFGLTIFPSLFTLQFMTNPGVRFLENVRARRLLMLAYLAVEIALVTLVVLRATS